MSATEELRRMLDERGVEWMPSAWSANDETFYKVGETGYLATELSSGRMKVCVEGYPTPEQAIEATIGRTCKPANVSEYAWDDFECSECGWVTWSFLMEHEGCGTVCKPRFCPNCGAKVVEDMMNERREA